VSAVDEVLTAFGKDASQHLKPNQGERVARSLQAFLGDIRIFGMSFCALPGGLLCMGEEDEETMILGISKARQIAPWFSRLQGDFSECQGLKVMRGPLSTENAAALRDLVAYTRPQPLGQRPSFGFGDRIGLATPGHAMAAALAKGRVLPIFAQQSIREMSRTDRTPTEVLDDATWGVFRMGWLRPFGADADHLKTMSDVSITAWAGFVFFTIDPSEHVDQEADDYNWQQVQEKFQDLIDSGVEGASEFVKLYQSKTIRIGSGGQLFQIEFDEQSLKRAAIKYGRALAHTYKMANHIGKVMGRRPFELEISVDETAQPTSALEHLFIILELKRHDVTIVSLAPKFVGSFEKAIDYKGDLSVFESTLKQHMAISEQFGPYKISVHSGSDKFGIYPILARVCQGHFHVKTAGTSYLEALRVVSRADSEFFRSIIRFARARFERDKATYQISSNLKLVPEPSTLEDQELERLYLDEDQGRQILHVTFGSVLTEKGDNGYRFREKIRTIIRQNQTMHEDVLLRHLGKHIRYLCQ
jgi:hypothetical protein